MKFALLLFGTLKLMLTASSAIAASSDEPLKVITSVFEQLVQENRIVGAQVIVGRYDTILLERNFGKRSPDSPAKVDESTLFCIGSDSKPMAAAIIMSLVGDGVLRLDAPVSNWLPDFASLKIQDGTSAKRAPTIRELLSHRSGIFSQMKNPSKQQLGLIYDFTRTLDEAVRGISREPLLTQPGEAVAYSGAGYCVLGRAAELASGSAIEVLLQTRLCRPLQLQNTTYFPTNRVKVAVGGRVVNGRTVPYGGNLHLGQRYRFPLVGGSIYSTGRDQIQFAQMVLGHGRKGKTEILSAANWTAWTSRQGSNDNYGLGWVQTFSKHNDKLTRLTHTGGMPGYRADIIVNLETGFIIVENCTLIEPEANGPVGPIIVRALDQAEMHLGNE